MREQLEILSKMDARAVMESPEHYLKMLKLYSILFLNGKQPSSCGQCAYKYFEELKTTGLERINFYEMKTCKLNPNKIYHVRVGNAIITYSDANMDDQTALELIQKGAIKESEFIKLPVINVEPKEITTELPVSKPEIKKRGRKHNETIK